MRVARGTIRARGRNQRDYLANIHAKDLTFGIGPAGTGKTYLAVACAVEALQADKIRRIILVRPAVEAGERLGFLPGDLTQKVDPYLRPMYDALYEMLGFDRVARFIERNVIEVAPLAFMRGRSLNDSFIILDEAQNTTPEQMKMFLTRIGFGSRAVVTGDVTQTDLPAGKTSGLKHVINILRNTDGVAFTFFEAADVVRHPLVQRIVQAYEAHTPQRKAMSRARGLKLDLARGTRAWAPARSRMNRWAAAALGRRGEGREIAVRVVGRGESRELNRQWRGKDKPTNVLSFPARLPFEAGPARQAADYPLPLGDLVICAEVVRREAVRDGKTIAAHWAHMVVHGALHLAGYDHEAGRPRAPAHGAARNRRAQEFRNRESVHMSAKEKAREKDKDKEHQRQRQVAAQAVAPHGGRGAGSRRGHRVPARGDAARRLEGDALPMLEGVLDGQRHPGARHHGAARADDRAQPRR